MTRGCACELLAHFGCTRCYPKAYCEAIWVKILANLRCRKYGQGQPAIATHIMVEGRIASGLLTATGATPLCWAAGDSSPLHNIHIFALLKYTSEWPESTRGQQKKVLESLNDRNTALFLESFTAVKNLWFSTVLQVVMLWVIQSARSKQDCFEQKFEQKQKRFSEKSKNY